MRKISTPDLKKKVKIESRWEVVKIADISKNIINGGTPSKENAEYWNSKDIRWLTIPDISDKKLFLSETSQLVSKKAVEENKTKIVPKNSVLITCTATIGKVCINEVELTTNQQINAIICNDLVIPQYLAYFLRTQSENLSNLTSNSGVKHVNLTMLNNFPIPLPPLPIQQRIVEEIEEVEEQSEKASNEIIKLKTEIEEIVSNVGGEEVKLGEAAEMLKRGKSAKYGNSKVQIIKSGQARGYKNFDFTEKHFVDDNFVVDERKLKKGDILINSSGVGTAGRVTLFDLSGDFVVDSHITILRPKTESFEPDYILYSLARIGFKNIEKMAHGQSGQIELTIKTIENIKIPHPLLEIQQRIVEEIQQLEGKIGELEQVLQESPGQKEAILKKYL